VAFLDGANPVLGAAIVPGPARDLQNLNPHSVAGALFIDAQPSEAVAQARAAAD
jgi:hypothetical protein